MTPSCQPIARPIPDLHDPDASPQDLADLADLADLQAMLASIRFEPRSPGPSPASSASATA